MAKSKTIYYGGLMFVLGAIVLSFVSLSSQQKSVDNRSNASNIGNAYPAQGAIDLAPNKLCQVKGWALDLDSPQQSLKVKAYLDRPYSENPDKNGLFLGDYMANLLREDVDQAFKIGGNHGFQIDLYSNDKMPKDSKNHQVYVYTLDSSNGSKYTLLTNSPKNLSCVEQ